MILRRISKAVQDQNWFAVAIEFMIVTAGVFLGIQVGNWNDQLADGRREKIYLERLKADFEDNIRIIDESIDRTRGLKAGADALYSLLNSGDQVTPEGVAPHMDAIISASRPAPASSTFLEMQSAGMLSTLNSERLRVALIDYDAASGIGESGLDFALRGFHPDRVAFRVVKVNPERETFLPEDIQNLEALKQNAGDVNYMQAAHALQLRYAKMARSRAETVLSEIEKSQQ